MALTMTVTLSDEDEALLYRLAAAMKYSPEDMLRRGLHFARMTIDGAAKAEAFMRPKPQADRNPI